MSRLWTNAGLMPSHGWRETSVCSPCIALVRPLGRAAVDQEKCRKCKKCIREIGCPGIVVEEGKVVIDMSQCTGCGICAEICPFDAIEVTRLPGGGEPKNAQQGKGGRA